MSEIRVKDNESLDSALRRFKRSCARSVCLLKCVNARLTKSLLSGARRSPKLPASASSNKNSGHAASKRTGGLYGPLFLHQKRAGEKAARRLPCPPDMHVRTEHN